MARAAAAIGVTVQKVREAWALLGVAAVPLDGSSVRSEGDLVPMASTNYTDKMRAANEARRRQKEPGPRQAPLLALL